MLLLAAAAGRLLGADDVQMFTVLKSATMCQRPTSPEVGTSYFMTLKLDICRSLM